MIRISEIHLKLDGSEEDLKKQAAARLKVAPEKIKSLKLYKKSIDARRKDDVHFICTVEVDCDLKFLPKDPKITKVEPYRYQLPAGKPRTLRPVVVGFGPAGLFAA